MGVALTLFTAGLLEGMDAAAKKKALWVCGLTLPALIFAYGWFRPEYLPMGRKWGVTDLGVGFLGGVEPFSTLLIAMAIYVLVRPQHFSPWIGIVGGWAVMTKESNVLIFGLFLLMWFSAPEGRWHAQAR